MTDLPRSQHAAPLVENRSGQSLLKIICLPSDVSEQDLTVLTPEAYFACLTAQGASQGVLEMSTKAPNPVDKYVGSRVRMRRIMLGMSQEKLGEALGLTFQQVQKYEKGTNRVGASRIQQIPKYFRSRSPFCSREDRAAPPAPKVLAREPPRPTFPTSWRRRKVWR